MARASRGRTAGFRVLVATDGSPAARAALDTTCVFPWPKSTRMRLVVAAPPEWVGGRPESVRIALLTALERIARTALRQLRRQWPNTDVMLTEQPATEGIVDAARRFEASLIVVGR